MARTEHLLCSLANWEFVNRMLSLAVHMTFEAGVYKCRMAVEDDSFRPPSVGVEQHFYSEASAQLQAAVLEVLSQFWLWELAEQVHSAVELQKLEQELLSCLAELEDRTRPRTMLKL